MKKASILILLILICCLGYGQTYPLQQNVGNTPTTKVKTNALEGKIIITAFTDTSAANSEGYLKNYDGAVIKTTTPINALWYRVLDSAKWVQILPTGGGTGGIRAWLDGGNYNVLADGQGNAVFGTLGKNGIKFTTQAIPRFILDSAGILSETGSTIGIGYDPSNGNRLTQYSGGGSGNYLDSFWRVSGIDSNYYRINGVTYAVLDSTGGGGTGWSLTGNAGTTAGTNFLGTTDNISLMFKTNNTQRAIITAAGVFTTSNDAIINKLNIGNGYYSSSSNTLLGYYAGTDYIDGSTNHGTSFTYIGSLSGAYNFGSDNTAIGTNSLQGVFGGSNTTASRNTSVGSGSGGGSGGSGITTAKNNVFLGFNSGGRITSGSSNFFGGNNSGYSVTTGSNNIVIGDSAMYGTVGIAQIGSNNIILGSSAGYHAANISNSFYVNTIKQSSYADDTSKSLLYGKFDASTNNQSLRLNAKRIYLPYLDNGVGTKAVRWSATQGLVLADTTVSGGGSGNYLDSFWRVPGIDSNYYRINGVDYAVLDSTGGGGGTYTADAPINITGTVISADTSKAAGKLATYSDIQGRADTSTVINSGEINWPGALYSTPTTASIAGHKISFAPALASQTSKYVFTNPSGSSGVPSFNLLDSSYLAGMHTQGYYDGRYMPAGQINGDSNYIRITANALGTTQIFTKGLELRNWTAAAAGAQQLSPALRFATNGWKTTATAESQPVEFWLDALPVQGTGNPTGEFRINSRINGGTAKLPFKVDNTGNITTTGFLTIGDNLKSTTNDWQFIGYGGQTFFRNSYGYITFSASGSNYFKLNTLTAPYGQQHYILATGIAHPFTYSTAYSGSFFGSDIHGFELNVSGAVDGGGGSSRVTTLYIKDSSTGANRNIGIEQLYGTNLFNTIGGSTQIGDTSTVPSSKFTVSSTTQGILIPRMTTTQRDAISSPATGLQVYDITTNRLNVYNGTIWMPVGGISGSYTTSASAQSTFTVTIGATMANSSYVVSATPTATLTAAPYYVTNKTTTTFDVVYLSPLTGTATFDWSVNY